MLSAVPMSRGENFTKDLDSTTFKKTCDYDEQHCSLTEKDCPEENVSQMGNTASDHNLVNECYNSLPVNNELKNASMTELCNGQSDLHPAELVKCHIDKKSQESMSSPSQNNVCINEISTMDNEGFCESENDSNGFETIKKNNVCNSEYVNTQNSNSEDLNKDLELDKSNITQTNPNANECDLICDISNSQTKEIETNCVQVEDIKCEILQDGNSESKNHEPAVNGFPHIDDEFLKNLSDNITEDSNPVDIQFLNSVQKLSLDFENDIFQQAEEMNNILDEIKIPNIEELKSTLQLDTKDVEDIIPCESSDIEANQQFHMVPVNEISQNQENSIESSTEDSTKELSFLDCVDDVNECSVLNNEVMKQNYEDLDSQTTSVNMVEDTTTKSEVNCSCERPPVANFEDQRSALLSAWNELRSSIRQIHRSVIPSSSSLKFGGLNVTNRPSINRIKALANMLLNHDPFQLFTRAHQLCQELCIELKVRLLATFHDSPDVEEALTFVKELCLSYELLMKVCELVQSAFDKLDSDYLMQFNLSWTTINVHAFYSSIFTDPDVQDYLFLCSSKIEGDEVKGGLECLTPLKTALGVAEEIWTKAEAAIQEYAVKRAAINVQRRQALNEWELFKTKQMHIEASLSQRTGKQDSSTVPDSKLINSIDKPKTDQKTASSSCECHYCSSASAKNVVNDGVFASTARTTGALPPLAQPHLSLYPHIHGTSSKTDSLTSQLLSEGVTAPAASRIGTKTSMLENPYLGSDLLTEQLIREWDLAYGDALAPPGQPCSSAANLNSLESLDATNQLKVLTVNASDLNETSADSVSQKRSHNSDVKKSVLPASHPTRANKDSALGATSQESSITVSSSSSSLGQGSLRSSFDGGSFSSGNESDFESDSHSGHDDEEHCDCCYCHMLQNKSGGRQRYQDRRDRLLKILSDKKREGNPECLLRRKELHCREHLKSSESCAKSRIKDGSHPMDDKDRESIDDILSYIEGKRLADKCPKKAAKRARQKQRRYALKRQAEERALGSDSYDDSSDKVTDSEDEEDGPLAELRRRAPDVTITVVKPGQQTSKGPHTRCKPSQLKSSVGVRKDHQPLPDRHPLATHPLNVPTTTPSDAWSHSKPSMPPGQVTHAPPTEPTKSTGPNASPGGGGLSSLLKGIENLSGDQAGDKDGKNSKMVTIRRVMDPVSSEPTVTITLKGEEPRTDKVLFKLVNGQACPGADPKNKAKSVAKTEKPAPQVTPVYEIPEGVSAEEAKRIRNRQKRARQKLEKAEQKRMEDEKEKMKILEIQKQKQFLKQQEQGIKKQQAALQKQQNELLKLQNSKNQAAKGKMNVNSANGKKNKDDKLSAVVYEGEDVARNFTLPPGVSINKVAGQPGMVTISNNMANHFTQPFLSNPNVYQPNIPGYPMPMHDSCDRVNYTGMYPNTALNMPWKESSEKSGQKGVIVVDANSNSTKPKNSKKEKKVETKKPVVESKKPKNDKKTKNETKVKSVTKNETKVKSVTKVVTKVKAKEEKKEKKTQNPKSKMSYQVFDKLAPEDKIEAALKEKVDPSWLNMTQKTKYKKRLKVIREEEERIAELQRDEDELMDRMYEMSMSTYYTPAKKKEKNTKNTSKKNCDNNAKAKQPQPPSFKTNKSQNNKKLKQSQSTSQNSVKQNAVEQPKKVNENKSSKNESNKNKAKTQTSGKNEQNQLKQTRSQTSHKNDQNQQKQSKSQQISQKNDQSQQKQSKTQQSSQKNDPKQSKVQQNQKLPQTSQSKGQTTSKPQKSHSEQPMRNSKQELSQKKWNEKVKRTQSLNQGGSANQAKRSSLVNTDVHSVRNHPYKGTTDGSKVPYDVSRAPTIGYANNDYGHEVRYAQYLAANASALANMDYEGNSMPVRRKSSSDGCNNPKNTRKRGKKGNIEDMTTIDSVFTPKELPSGELDDETDREVEAFKRFCLYNVPRSNGEKPKVNFNVKDIMIKKKH